jgi:hypothetical protein
MTTAVSTEVLEEGSLGLLPEDLQPPRLQFSGKKGEFTLAGMSEALESVLAVPLLKLRNTRVKFSEEEDSSEIECQSEDSLMPVDQSQAQAIGAGPSCTACPFSKFGRDSKGNAVRPACTEYRNFAMASVPEEGEEEPTPFLFSVKSMAIKPMMAAMAAVEYRRRKQHKPGYAYVLELKAGSEISQGKRSWYPLEVSVVPEPVPDFLLPLYRAHWQMMASLSNRLTLSDEPAEQASFDDQPLFDANGNDLPSQRPAATNDKPASDAQKHAIKSIAKTMGITPDILRGWLLEQVGADLDALTGAQASQAIQQLQADKTAVPA